MMGSLRAVEGTLKSGDEKEIVQERCYQPHRGQWIGTPEWRGHGVRRKARGLK